MRTTSDGQCLGWTEPTLVLDHDAALETETVPCPVCGDPIGYLRLYKEGGRYWARLARHKPGGGKPRRRARPSSDEIPVLGTLRVVVPRRLDALEDEWLRREVDHALSNEVHKAQRGPWLEVTHVRVESAGEEVYPHPELARMVRAIVGAIDEAGAWREIVGEIRSVRVG